MSVPQALPLPSASRLCISLLPLKRGNKYIFPLLTYSVQNVWHTFSLYSNHRKTFLHPKTWEIYCFSQRAPGLDALSLCPSCRASPSAGAVAAGACPSPSSGLGVEATRRCPWRGMLPHAQTFPVRSPDPPKVCSLLCYRLLFCFSYRESTYNGKSHLSNSSWEMPAVLQTKPRGLFSSRACRK